MDQVARIWRERGESVGRGLSLVRVELFDGVDVIVVCADMIRRGRLVMGTLLSAWLIAAVLAAAPARAEGDRHLTLDYAVYIGGIETIRFSFNTRLRATDYSIKMALALVLRDRRAPARRCS